MQITGCTKCFATRMQPLMDFMQDGQNKRCVHQLQEALGKMRDVSKRHENRRYYPRVL